MANAEFTSWSVFDGHYTQEVVMPSEWGSAEVRKDLTENCGFPENIVIKRMKD